MNHCPVSWSSQPHATLISWLFKKAFSFPRRVYRFSSAEPEFKHARPKHGRNLEPTGRPELALRTRNKVSVTQCIRSQNLPSLHTSQNTDTITHFWIHQKTIVKMFLLVLVLKTNPFLVKLQKACFNKMAIPTTQFLQIDPCQET